MASWTYGGGGGQDRGRGLSYACEFHKNPVYIFCDVMLGVLHYGSVVAVILPAERVCRGWQATDVQLSSPEVHKLYIQWIREGSINDKPELGHT